MKHALLKISTFLLLLIPFISSADIPGGHHVSVHTSFVITNVDSFKEYQFFYLSYYDTIKIKQGKKYSFSHGGNPNSGWNIKIYAKNNATGKITLPIAAGETGRKEIITIREIKNDTIYFNKKEESDSQGSSFSSPVSDNQNDNGISNTTYLLLGISVCGLFIYCCSLFLRKPILKEN